MSIGPSKGHLERDGNRIIIAGHFGADNFRTVLSMVYQAIKDRGYRDYVLDFSNCTAAFPVAMLPVCAQALRFAKDRIDVSLILPSDSDLERLFFNANWAHLIDDRRPASTFRGYLQIPATVFGNSTEQFALVNKVIESILRSTPELVREDLAAIEWAFNEITDNVLNHSRSEIGGIIQFSTRTKSKRIEFAVCDSGIGVAASLRPTHPEIPNDLESLAWAIREGGDSRPGDWSGKWVVRKFTNMPIERWIFFSSFRPIRTLDQRSYCFYVEKLSRTSTWDGSRCLHKLCSAECTATGAQISGRYF